MFCNKCGKADETTNKVFSDCGRKAVFSDDSDTDSEKTVTADYEAIARKAAVASFSTFQAEKLKKSTGFDINNAKTVMNGRSVLIDDSPVSDTTSVYNRARLNDTVAKKHTCLIISAVVVAIIIIGAILFAVFSQNGGSKTPHRAVTTSEENTTCGNISHNIPDNTMSAFSEDKQKNNGKLDKTAGSFEETPGIDVPVEASQAVTLPKLPRIPLP